ncbi:GNAT family N-acetyltransferase [Fructilactobacillus vespulae]|uniref:GNAT family N-acetyltransferase n=1 Tax=Fructilactobacillus vespulae TaxID=1249630 RepID=UPI0039B47207
MVEIEVTRVTTDDVLDLQSISGQTFTATFGESIGKQPVAKYVAEAYSPEQLTKEIENQNSYFYFAKVNGQVAGYIKINVDDAQTEAKGRDYLEVQRIYLLSQFKRMGIGTRLLYIAEDKARKLGKSKIWLGVWEENDKARAFYEAKGFVRNGEHIFQTGNTQQVDLLLEKFVKY